MPFAIGLLIYLAILLSGVIAVLVCSVNEAFAESKAWASAIDEEIGDDDDYCVDSPDDVEEAIQLVRAAEYNDGFEDGITFARNKVNSTLDQIDPEFDGAICDLCIEDASVGDSADHGHDNDDSLDLALEEAGQRK